MRSALNETKQNNPQEGRVFAWVADKFEVIFKF